MSQFPSPFPFFDIEDAKLHDGSLIAACGFCKKSHSTKPACSHHYTSLKSLPEGYYQCPFGFTTRTFFFRQQMCIITGLVAFPRFNTTPEREMAKRFPENKGARADIDSLISVLREIDQARADAIQDGAKVFPQAFHELRKLNGAILQHAEKDLREHGETPTLLTIKSAAELMRNNFNILEALSNIDGMRALPLDATICLHDLVYKTQRVYQERANARGIRLSITGVRAIVPGSQKSFPIVPAVLIENAIKYGKSNSTILADISANGKKAVLKVCNETGFHIDSEHCFERGSRYAPGAAEGSGFGLYLAKQIVLAHHGIIKCQVEGCIVEMVVELPLVKVIEF